MKYKEFRNKYPKFIYHDYDIYEDDNAIIITYNFEIEGLSSFNPTWTINKKDNKRNKQKSKDF